MATMEKYKYTFEIRLHSSNVVLLQPVSCVCVAGLLSDWYPNLDALKESCRIASSYNWADVDLSPFQGAVTNRCFGIYIEKLCGNVSVLFVVLF